MGEIDLLGVPEFHSMLCSLQVLYENIHLVNVTIMHVHVAMQYVLVCISS